MRTQSDHGDLQAFIEGMPKVELHVHLEGTLEPELKFELAARNGIELPYASVDEMRAAYTFDDLTSFLAVYYEGISVLRTEQDFYDLAMAYFRKVHSQHLVYAEPFFDPQAHTERGIAFATVIDGIQRAQRDAEASLGIRSRLILCFLRELSTDSAMATLEAALPYRDGIVGVGIDSEELGNPPAKFKAVFDRARAEGFHLTMHCDVDQQDSVDHIWQCLDVIGVERVDHAANAVEDERLVGELVRRGIGVTACPISNSYVTDGTKAADIRHLIDAGVRVSVNSDDPAYFPGYVTENLVVLQREAALSRDEVVQLERNAIGISWATEEERRRYLDGLEAYAREAAGQPA